MINRTLLVSVIEAGLALRPTSGVETEENGSDIAEFEEILLREAPAKGGEDAIAVDVLPLPLVLREASAITPAATPAFAPALPGAPAAEADAPAAPVAFAVPALPSQPKASDPLSAPRSGVWASPLPAAPQAAAASVSQTLNDAPSKAATLVSVLQTAAAAPAPEREVGPLQPAARPEAAPKALPEGIVPQQKEREPAPAGRGPNPSLLPQARTPPMPAQQAVASDPAPLQPAAAARMPLPITQVLSGEDRQKWLEYSQNSTLVRVSAPLTPGTERPALHTADAGAPALSFAVQVPDGLSEPDFSVPVTLEPGPLSLRADKPATAEAGGAPPFLVPPAPPTPDGTPPSAIPELTIALRPDPPAVASPFPEADGLSLKNDPNIAENASTIMLVGTAAGTMIPSPTVSVAEPTVMPPLPADTADATAQVPMRSAPPPVLLLIVERAQAAQGGPITVTLRPEELGTLRFEVRQGEQGLHLHLAVDQPATLDLLRRHSEQLLQDLRQAGFAGATLSYSDGNASAGGFGGTGDEASSHKGGGGAVASPFLTALPADAAAGPLSCPAAGTLDLRL